MSDVGKTVLDAVVHKLTEEAVELIPVAVSALNGLLAGKPPERVLSQAERDTLAHYAQKRLDAALERGKGKPPVPGSGV